MPNMKNQLLQKTVMLFHDVSMEMRLYKRALVLSSLRAHLKYNTNNRTLVKSKHDY